MTPVLPFIGSIVHVRGDEGYCAPAIVIDTLDGERLRLRVLYVAPVTEAPDSRDVVSVYPPEWSEPVFTNPDGTSRRADSWHWPYHEGRSR